MADKFFSFSNNGSEERSWRSDEDFDEEDVWGVVKTESSSPKNLKKSKDISFISTPMPLPSAPKLVPSSKTNGGSNFVQQSAPVDIPDWSKIYSNKGSENGSWGDAIGGVDFDSDVEEEEEEEENDNGGDDDHCKTPPHEWVAKKLARSQISSFSVCEGVGRTLKGRDLSKVRDAVLTRTGFLE